MKDRKGVIFQLSLRDKTLRVEDGEALYHGCTEYLTENKNYSGERAKYFMEYLHGPDFPDEEIKYY